MLSGLLEKEECKNCKYCCGFDKSDFWETPAFSEKAVEEIRKSKPETCFTKYGNIYKWTAGDFEGIKECPALTENGCSLGDEEKPFECRIWPFRLMRLSDNSLCIAVSSDCRTMMEKPVGKIRNFLYDKLDPAFLFGMAEKYPEIVKDYDGSYCLLMTESNY